MKFDEVLRSKISGLEAKKRELQSTISDPKYHVQEVHRSVTAAIAQIDDLPDDAEKVKAEFASVLQQVPELVALIWANAIKRVNGVQQELAKLEEMKKLYLEWEESEKKKAEREQELLEKIRSGEIKEPTKMTAIRRKSGTRPEVSLGNYRRVAKSIEGEESEE